MKISIEQELLDRCADLRDKIMTTESTDLRNETIELLGILAALIVELRATSITSRKAAKEN